MKQVQHALERPAVVAALSAAASAASAVRAAAGAVPRRRRPTAALVALLLGVVVLFTIRRAATAADSSAGITEVCSSQSWGDPDKCRVKSLYEPPGTPVKRALYYNTHFGAGANVAAVAEALGVRVDMFSPHAIAGYGMSHRRAQALLNSGHVAHVCSLYDAIILGDTIPHGRAILLSLVDSDRTRRCRSKVVVEMTNRFDWSVADKSKYYSLFRKLVRSSTNPSGELYGKLFWVANNNVEQRYMEHKLNIWMPVGSVRIIRPMGISGDYPYPNDLPNPDFQTFAARTHDTTQIFEKFKTIHNIPLTIFPFNHNYGGPKNLLKFKGWIDVPYQYSVMKFYENIAYGVPQFVPTPQFYEYLVTLPSSFGIQAGLHFTHCIFLEDLKEYERRENKRRAAALKLAKATNSSAPLAEIPEEWKSIANFPRWSGFMDYYDPLFAPYVYYFESYEELRRLRLVQRVRDVDWKRVRDAGPVFYANYRENVVLKEWRTVFSELGFSVRGNATLT
ncbi:hypothetical protein HDU83_002914 [Entophlyctis luteolus]|nr:hypothetical protein HDU83_002914 [Entophlyctis luteolus]